MGGNPFEELALVGEQLSNLTEATAAAAEPLLLKAAQEHLRAGADPEGKAWAPKKGGGRALAGAANAVRVSRKGSTIALSIGGADNAKYVFHDHGAGAKSESAGAERARRKHARDQEKRRAVGETVGASKFHAPARKIIPNATDPVPASYSKALADAAEQSFDRAVEGKR